jgi:plastocyanin
MARRFAVAFVTTATAALALAGAAQAQTWTLYVGGYGGPGANAIVKQAAGSQLPAVMQVGPSIDEFSLPSLKIHVGDTVKWLSSGGHTVTFATGKTDIPLFAPDPSAVVTNVLDANNTPFWFNSQPQLDFDPRGVVPSNVRTVHGQQVGVEDGTKLVGSGLYTGNGNAPNFVLKFTKAGTFEYQCAIHPNMNGAIKVLPKRAKVPSPAADLAHEKAIFARQVKNLIQLANYTPPANTVSAGHDVGQLSLLSFFPSTLHVAVGATVTFSETSDVEVHTFSFGPSAYLSNISNNSITPIPAAGGPPTLEFNPQIAYSTDIAGSSGIPQYTGTNHGNGFFSTGILDGIQGSTQASSFQVKFTKAGTYNFQCLIHPFMKGQIVVG